MSNQTAELGKWLDTHLRGRKYPFRVRYAPERTERTKHDPVILIMRDTDTSEKIETAHGTQKNGRKYRTRRIPVKIKVYAKSSLDGARLEEHEELADYLVDALVTALEIWSTAERGGGIEFGEMAFLTPAEVVTADGAPEGWPGVVYLMRFTIGRGVVERDYLKQVRPTGTINGASSTVEVRQTNEDGTAGDPAIQPPPEEEP
jgi:hypothetical protein